MLGSKRRSNRETRCVSRAADLSWPWKRSKTTIEFFCTWFESIKKAGTVSQKKQADHFAIVILEAVKRGTAIGVRF
jgi:hypothetical protein